MKARELYTHLQEAIGGDLKSKEIAKGMSYFWLAQRSGSNTTRVLRIHEDDSGSVTEIKLPVTSLRTHEVVTLPLPATVAEVVTVMRREIDLLEQ